MLLNTSHTDLNKLAIIKVHKLMKGICMSKDNKKVREEIVPKDAPVPHPLTPEANKDPKPGELSDPDNNVRVDDEDIV